MSVFTLVSLIEIVPNSSIAASKHDTDFIFCEAVSTKSQYVLRTQLSLGFTPTTSKCQLPVTTSLFKLGKV